jgi:hypothetical protein
MNPFPFRFLFGSIAMKKLLLLLLGVGIFVAILAFMEKPKLPFPVGKATTYVTEPLDEDGRIDYAGALNERLSEDVTPRNNANVLLWKAFGPHPEGATMPEEFFQWLGIEPLPEQGDYFIPLRRYLREQGKQEPVRDANAPYEKLSHCTQNLWKASEHKDIAAWLKANEKPLALVLEASKRSHYFSPWTPKRTEKGPSPLFNALLPGVQACRELAQALTARAMLRLGEGRFDEAWQDLLACHRLGRLLSHGGSMVEFLVALALDTVAGKADLAFLVRAPWKGDRIQNCLRDLQQLPPMAPLADKVDSGERFMILDTVTMIDRYGPESLESLSRAASPKEPSFFSKLFHASIDWEPALSKINRWYDRIAKALRNPNRDAREKELKQIEADLKELKYECEISVTDKLYLFIAPDSARIRGELIGKILIGLMMPALSKVQSASDRCEQQQNNLYLAFALAAYQRDHGHYPKKLDDLTPKYLDNIPIDLFSGEPLVYRPSKNGYLLYSVGVNGRDEAGLGPEDEPPGDDLTVRMPRPELKQKEN